MKNSLILLFSLMVSVPAFGQELFRVTGRVSGCDGENMAGQVYLLDKQGTLQDYAIVENGRFVLAGQLKGYYQLRVEVPGCAFYEETLELNRDLELEIGLEPEPEQLDEVTLTGKRRPIRFDRGNITVNVAGSYLETLPGLKDILSRLPGVMTGPGEEEISIVGKGTPLIYMDDRRVGFEEVRAIPAGRIESVEILKHPSARYEGEGRSVIIVRLREEPEQGYGFALSETASFKRRFNNYSSLTANYNQGKFSAGAHVAFNRLHHWESNQSGFVLPEEDIASDYHVVTSSPRPQIVAGGHVHYRPDQRTTLSFTADLRTQKEDFPIRTDTYLRKGDDVSNIVTLTENKDRRDYVTSGLSFTRKIDTTNTLFIGGQYTGFYQKLETGIYNNINGQGFIAGDLRDQDFRTHRGMVRVDYEHKGSDKLLFETGLNMALAGSRSFTSIAEQPAGREEVTTYDYTENVFSGYAQASGSLEKWTYAAGLRLERSDVSGKFGQASAPEIDRQNTNALPFAKLSYIPGENRELTFNYKRSVQRPSYFMASSITAFINPFLEFSRNISLKPTYTSEVGLNYQWKAYNLGVSYHYINDPIYLTVRYQGQEERLLMSMDNLDREEVLQAEVSAPFTYKFLTATSTVMLVWTDIRDNDAVSAYRSRPFLYYYSNIALDLIPEMDLAIDLWGQTSRYEGIYRRKPLFVTGASLSRTFFGNLQLSLNLKDIFRQMNFHQSYQMHGVRAHSVFFADGREIAIGVKYTFGSKSGTEKHGKVIDEESSRVN
ncbi:outer membrane beta-barrel family protein [Sinomicrobium soli]|uniref:outer membrane beta-barrel family protein n=1 Tax=Sinomicrobium sp. N-1-3-6 TaxID=2219864 RepID=UPI000DCEE04A|nr:outer membrane beta-barrel family protein [Sinomicrobium sp. N-1-3-6]RAV27689.1 hypothetical protein DN748_17490 [Sinomicrobium sp. N-1-3-6]